MIATRDIQAGEVIMEEPPITAGPKQFTGVVCLGTLSKKKSLYVE